MEFTVNMSIWIFGRQTRATAGNGLFTISDIVFSGFALIERHSDPLSCQRPGWWDSTALAVFCVKVGCFKRPITQD